MATLTPQTEAYLASGVPTDLALVDVSLLPPNFYGHARVGYTGDWSYYATSTVTSDSITVVNGLSGGAVAGRWLRGVSGTPGANLIAQWYVNSSTGADTNDGLTTGTALATIAEVFRRIGRQAVAQNTTVTVAGNIAGALPIDVYVEQGVTLTIQGTRTVAVADQLAARTVWAASTQAVGAYTFTTTTGSLAAYVGAAFVQVHATPSQSSPVVKDLTSGQFRGLFCDTAAAGAQVEPGASALVDIYTVNSIAGNVTVHVRGAGYVKFIDLNVASTGITKVTSGGAIFQSCLVHSLTVTRSAHDVQIIASQAFDTIVYGRLQVSGSVCTYSASSALGVAGNSGTVQVLTLSLVQGGPLNVGNATEGSGFFQTVAPLAVADYGASYGVTVWPGSTLRVGDYFFITKGTPAAALGYVVMDGARIHYTGGKLIAAGGTAPTGFSTVAGTAKATGALPYVEATAGLAAIIVDI